MYIELIWNYADRIQEKIKELGCFKDVEISDTYDEKESIIIPETQFQSIHAKPIEECSRFCSQYKYFTLQTKYCACGNKFRNINLEQKDSCKCDDDTKQNSVLYENLREFIC